MDCKTALCLTVCFLFCSISHADSRIWLNSFDAPDGSGYIVNDFYVDTGDTGRFPSLIYCELDSGHFQQNPPFIDSMQWSVLPGLNDIDSWLAPGNIAFANAHELATTPGFSGDPANAAVSVVALGAMVDDKPPLWDGILFRLLFSADANGQWVVKTGTKHPETGETTETLLTGVVIDGAVTATPAIPGDLNGDSVVDLADRDIIMANWGGDFIIVGDLASGDASYDGVVDEADLAIWQNAVPEPSVGVLSVLFLLGLIVRSRPFH